MQCHGLSIECHVSDILSVNSYTIKRRGRFLECGPANPEFRSSIKGGWLHSRNISRRAIQKPKRETLLGESRHLPQNCTIFTLNK